MALISEKKFLTNSLNGNGYDSQVNYFSQTTLLTNRIHFKSEKELTSDNDSDSDETMSIQKLKTKYHVLQPDTNAESVKKLYSSGFYSNLKAKHVNLKESKDGNELCQPRNTLYPRENIVLEWKRMNKIGSGLQNLGNTCFMNSVLQCLTYCPPLVNYLFSIKDEHSTKCRLNFCMICLMSKHVNLAFTRNCQTLRPLYICQRLKSIAKHFTFGHQEDAHEFLRYVIDHMWRACLSIHENEFGFNGITQKLDQLTKATTAINQIFGGYHRSQVICLQCKEKSNTYDYFMDFMLEIQNVSSLQEALEKFVAPEILRNDNAYKCSHCKKSVVAKKQFNVHRAPNVATFQFKRFDCSRMFGKITKAISYPEKLDLRPYMSEKGSPLIYKLISVLVHYGSSSNSGHYYCYVRNSNNCWYLMNDSQVNQVNLGEVLNQKAYVLFYIRLPTNENGPQSKLTPQSYSNAQQKSFTYLNSSVPKQSQPSQNSNFKSTLNSISNGNSSSSKAEPVLKVSSLSGTSLKINITKSVTNGVSNGLSKTNTLVPYDEDSDDSKKGKKSEIHFLSNGKGSLEPKSTLNIDLSKTNKAVSVEQSREKDAIPILKVKATTDSWQVVESIPSKQNDCNENKTISNWKISKAGEFVKENIKQSSEISSHNIINKIKLKKDSESESESCKLQNEIRKKKKDKKQRKKKHKKNKEKKRKRRDSQQSDNSDFDSSELSWVERTKETLELETSDSNKNIIPSQSVEKRKYNQIAGEDVDDSSKKVKYSEPNKKPDILDALLKKSSIGYGEEVKTWNDESSQLNEHNDDVGSRDSDDDYNEEFDRGKVKKSKTKFESHNDSFNSKENPFQRMQQLKYNNTTNSSHNNGPYRSTFSKHTKMNNFKFHSNKPFNNFGKDKHFNKHEKFSSSKNGHHFHHKTNSSSSFSKSKSNLNFCKFKL